jgi:hypothetical protein
MGADIAAVFNMLLDPASAVKRIDSKWIWVFPLLLLGLVSSAIAWIIIPITSQVLLRNPPEGSTREQIQQSLPMIEKFSMIGVFGSPVIIVIMTLLLALLLLVACQVIGLQVPFKHAFNLISMASIIKVLGAVAAFAVIQLKGSDMQTVQELSPSLGLDILLPEGTHRALFAAVNYFSIFQIWFIVALVIALAALTKSSKAKAFFAVTPVWLIPLCFAVGGALLRRA